MTHHRRAGIGALSFVMLLAACGGGSSGLPTPTPPPDVAQTIELPPGQPIRLGVSAPLTGEQGALGTDLADAVELASRDAGASIKGRAVRVVRMDDGCGDPQKAAGVARSFVADPAIAGVIGPMCTTGAQAADSLYDAAHILHVLPAATRDDLSKQGETYFFRTAWTNGDQARTQAQYLRRVAGVSTAVLIDDTEPYGKTLADGFDAHFSAAGGTIVSRERIQQGDADFAPLARKVVAANPNAVVFEGLNPEAGLVLRALRDGGYGGWFVVPDAVLSARDFIDPLRDPNTGVSLADGAVITAGPTPDAAFVVAFTAAFKRPSATPFVLQAHDAATMLLRAIDAVATLRADGTLVIDRAQLRDALRAQSFQGLTGTLHFDAQGDRGGDTPVEAGVAVYNVVDGQFKAQ